MWKTKYLFIDKSASLLLCSPPHQITAKQSINEHSENELRKKRAQLFDPIKDFRKYQSKYRFKFIVTISIVNLTKSKKSADKHGVFQLKFNSDCLLNCRFSENHWKWYYHSNARRMDFTGGQKTWRDIENLEFGETLNGMTLERR